MKSVVEIEMTLTLVDTVTECVEVLVKVEANYYPGSPAVFYMSNGDPGHPAEPDEVEVLKIVRKDTGEELEWDSLPETCKVAMEEAVREHVSDAAADEGPEPSDPTPEDLTCRAEYYADTMGER